MFLNMVNYSVKVSADGKQKNQQRILFSSFVFYLRKNNFQHIKTPIANIYANFDFGFQVEIS